MIPRPFFWVFDLAAFFVAFALAHALLLPTQALATIVIKAALPVATLPPWLGIVPSLGELAWILVIVSAVGVLVLVAMRTHRNLLEQSVTWIVLTSVIAPIAGLSLVTQILFVLKNPDWSRLFIYSFTALSIVNVAAYRLLFRAYFTRRKRLGVYARNLLLVGQDSAVARLNAQAAPMVAGGQYKVRGFLDLTGETKSDDELDVPHLGSVSQLKSILIHRPIDEVILVQPRFGGPWLEQIVHDCDDLGVPVRVVPEELLDFEPRVLRRLYPSVSFELPAVVLTTRHWDSNALFFKRLFDLTVTILLLVVLSPILALTALAVKLSSSGPVLYTWRVVGQQGREFTGYKFRTMIADADARKAELMAQNEMRGPVFKMAKDPRTTAVGRVLRKYSLDELPQLYSVLKGDMSLVGPRPAFRNELERYEFWQKRKLSIRPGITCLWQVNGRNHVNDFNDWVKMDLEYIDKWSLWLDFKIIVRTVWCVVAGTGR